jgi:oleate hydratase
MSKTPKAYLVGGGIGSLAAAAFMIRDGGLPGGSISILEASPIMGGSLDGARVPAGGYSLRGGRMLTTDNYECTWDLYKTIPSLNDKDKTVLARVQRDCTQRARRQAGARRCCSGRLRTPGGAVRPSSANIRERSAGRAWRRPVAVSGSDPAYPLAPWCGGCSFGRSSTWRPNVWR